MTGQKKAASKKSRWRVVVVGAAAIFLTIAAAVIVNYVRRDADGGQARNVAANTSSSAVVQGGNVNSITVYNGPPAPQASPVPLTPTGQDEPPSPASAVKQPTPKPLPALLPYPPAAIRTPPASRAPDDGRAASANSSAPKTEGSYAYRRCGIEYNHDGEIALSSGWSIKSLGFFARYTAAGTEEKQTTSIYFYNDAPTRSAGKPEEAAKPFLMSFKVPGEDREEPDVHVYRGFKREFEADGCFYTFSVTEVEGKKISYSFRGTGPLIPVASQ